MEDTGLNIEEQTVRLSVRRICRMNEQMPLQTMERRCHIWITIMQ